MNTEFNWWLLIVGLALGAGVVWLVLADVRRREFDITERERESEARWIGEAMRDAGRTISDADALDVLRLHEAYLGAPPPDEVDELDEDEADDVPSRPMRARSVETRPAMAHPNPAAAAESLDAER